jgi:hypothetical protein
MYKALLVLFTFLIATSFAAPAQVIVIRHGEKFKFPPFALDEKGQERAAALGPYFAERPEVTLFGPPDAIFAARPTPNGPPYSSDGKSMRCVQTVVPTAELFKLSIHAGFSQTEEHLLVNFILNNPEYDGKNIIICWHHEQISDIIQAFGYNPIVFPHHRFDVTYVMTFPITNPNAVVLAQKLLFGDHPNP